MLDSEEEIPFIEYFLYNFSSCEEVKIILENNSVTLDDRWNFKFKDKYKKIILPKESNKREIYLNEIKLSYYLFSRIKIYKILFKNIIEIDKKYRNVSRLKYNSIYNAMEYKFKQKNLKFKIPHFFDHDKLKIINLNNKIETLFLGHFFKRNTFCPVIKKHIKGLINKTCFYCSNSVKIIYFISPRTYPLDEKYEFKDKLLSNLPNKIKLVKIDFICAFVKKNNKINKLPKNLIFIFNDANLKSFNFKIKSQIFINTMHHSYNLGVNYFLVLTKNGESKHDHVIFSNDTNTNYD